MNKEKMPEDICLVPRESENVHLRPPRKEDVEFFVQMLNNPRINRFLMRRFPLPFIEEEEWIENNAEQTKNKESAHFTIELKPSENKDGEIKNRGVVNPRFSFFKLNKFFPAHPIL